jgi:hypothetical protein
MLTKDDDLSAGVAKDFQSLGFPDDLPFFINDRSLGSAGVCDVPVR